MFDSNLIYYLPDAHTDTLKLSTEMNLLDEIVLSTTYFVLE